MMSLYWIATLHEQHGWLHGGYRLAMAITMGGMAILSGLCAWLKKRGDRA